MPVPLDIDQHKARDLAQKNLDRLQAPIPDAEVSTATAPAAVTASAPSDPGRRIALVIGNGTYAHAPHLPNPSNDAAAFASALRRLGFADVRESNNLGLTDLTRELKRFGDLAATADWAVIFYAGHGIEVGGINYLIPVDAKLARQDHIDDEGLPLSRLLSKAEGARKMRLVILDACRNNPFRMAATGRRTRSIGRGLGRIEPMGGVLVAYAALDGTVADGGTGAHSPFTAALLEQLHEPGLEIGLLFRKVRDAVLRRTGGGQEPFTYGSLPSEGLYFKVSPPPR